MVCWFLCFIEFSANSLPCIFSHILLLIEIVLLEEIVMLIVLTGDKLYEVTVVDTWVEVESRSTLHEDFDSTSTHRVKVTHSWKGMEGNSIGFTGTSGSSCGSTRRRSSRWDSWRYSCPIIVTIRSAVTTIPKSSFN